MQHVALITGSTRGLGRTIALDLAVRSIAVVVHGRSEHTAGHALCSEMTSAGHAALYCPFDVGDVAAVSRGVNQIEATLGPITMLINCASQFESAPIDDLDPARWHAVLDATLSGTFHLCQTVIPRMRQRGWGRVINVGCVGCDRVYHAAHSVPYRIAASGNLALTRAYAQRAMADGVTVNLIAPGHMENTEGPVDLTKLPTGRLTKLDEILPTLHFLLSDEAGHVSGACINVAGGYVA